MDSSARHLAFTRRPHKQDPTGALVAWFTEPPGALIQMTREGELTVAMARAVILPGCDELLARFSNGEPLTLVLDISLMEKRETAVRAVFVDAAKRLGARIGAGIVIAPKSASKIYLMSLQAAVATLRVFGVNLEIQSSLQAVVTAMGIRPTER